MTDRSKLKAWCHWKKIEQGVSADDVEFATAIESVLAERDRYERALERTLDRLDQTVDDPDTVAIEMLREALAGKGRE